ncbi:hypothetical protein ACQ4PT_038246 [Festuca glaucescens]
MGRRGPWRAAAEVGVWKARQRRPTAGVRKLDAAAGVQWSLERDCWHPQESRVIKLSLSGFGLQGTVPSPLKYCRSVVTLDLSNNSLEGPIPPTLCDWLPYLIVLDLSGNRLSGPIPSELANCTYLNSLKLNNNALSGQIPESLSRLIRLKSLDLSDNRLEG